RGPLLLPRGPRRVVRGRPEDRPRGPRADAPGHARAPRAPGVGHRRGGPPPGLAGGPRPEAGLPHGRAPPPARRLPPPRLPLRAGRPPTLRVRLPPHPGPMGPIPRRGEVLSRDAPGGRLIQAIPDQGASAVALASGSSIATASPGAALLAEIRPRCRPTA